ncbi:hypothetical protein D8B26_005378 [Coccidioides posadasii str. Silveira]|nr:hypothetical protein D8B26_005378 [Coccidioides posadasii str. Silveira]
MEKIKIPSLPGEVPHEGPRRSPRKKNFTSSYITNRGGTGFRRHRPTETAVTPEKEPIGEISTQTATPAATSEPQEASPSVPASPTEKHSIREGNTESSNAVRASPSTPRQDDQVHAEETPGTLREDKGEHPLKEGVFEYPNLDRSPPTTPRQDDQVHAEETPGTLREDKGKRPLKERVFDYPDLDRASPTTPRQDDQAHAGESPGTLRQDKGKHPLKEEVIEYSNLEQPSSGITFAGKGVMDPTKAIEKIYGLGSWEVPQAMQALFAWESDGHPGITNAVAGLILKIRGHSDRIKCNIESIAAWHGLQKDILDHNAILEQLGAPEQWNYSVDRFQETTGLTMPDDPRYFFSANSSKKAHEASQNIHTIDLRVDSGRPHLHCDVVAWVQPSAAECQVFVIYEYQGIKVAQLEPGQRHSFSRHHLPQMRYRGGLMPGRETWLANRPSLNGIQLVAKDINEERYCVEIKYPNGQVGYEPLAKLYTLFHQSPATINQLIRERYLRQNQRFLEALEADETANENLESSFDPFRPQNHVDTVSSQQRLKFEPFRPREFAVTQRPEIRAGKFLDGRYPSPQRALMAKPKRSQKEDPMPHERFQSVEDILLLEEGSPVEPAEKDPTSPSPDQRQPVRENQQQVGNSKTPPSRHSPATVETPSHSRPAWNFMNLFSAKRGQ